MIKNTFAYKREKEQNPYIGVTSFQHFGNEVLYTDLVVKPENNMTETEHVECYPIPSTTEENGVGQGYYPPCSIAYIRVLWKEFEPSEGQYNYAFIEDILNKAKAKGQTVMFRLMQHSTRESDDVPDWLKEKIECPERPNGMRVKDCPSDPEFLVYFGRAVRALGERFDRNETLAFMDISLPGAWGEGSHTHLFTEKQLEDFVDIYTDVFRNTLLIGQTYTPSLIKHSNKKTSVGWRADCVGKPELTYGMLPPKVEKIGNIWKKGHISFESYWWLGEWKRQGWDVDKILQAMLSWHVSSFNPKSLPIPFEWKDKIDKLIDKMGYHYKINSFSTPQTVKKGKQARFTVEIENVGVAPIYKRVPLVVRLKGEQDSFEFETDADVRKWLPGIKKQPIRVALPENMPGGRYSVELSIRKGETIVYFCTDAEENGGFYKMAEIMVE